MKRFSVLLVAFGMLLSLAATASAQVFSDHGMQWPLKQLNAPHFVVLYPARLEAEAQQVAVAAEAIHDPVLGVTGNDPGRTYILIDDEQDNFNGYALPGPRPLVRLYLTFPRPLDIGAQWEDALRVLIAHEFTHVAHLTTQDPLRRAAERLFGRIPGVTTARMPPPWFVEGYAVYVESILTGGGRSWDASVRGLRAGMALGGDWPSLADISLGTREDYPAGNTRYSFGAGFVPFLAGRVGQTGLRAAVRAFNGLALSFDQAWLAATGADLAALYDQWTANELAAARASALALESSGLPSGSAPGGAVTGSRPAFSPAGTLVYWNAGSVWELVGGRAQRVIGLPSRPDRLSVAADGSLIYSRVTSLDEHSYARVYRVRAGREAVLPDSEHVREAVAAEGLGAGCVIGVRDTLSDSELVDWCGGPRRVLFAAPPGAHLFQPAVSAGGRVAVAVWRLGGLLDVAEVKLDGAPRLAFMTSDRAQDAWPVWLPDGRLVFTSDRGGSVQLFAAPGPGGDLSQLTAAPGGIYNPSLNPLDPSNLAFSTYGAGGAELRVATLRSGVAAPPAAPATPDPGAQTPQAVSFPTGDYVPDLRPLFWLPVWTGGLGVSVEGADQAGLVSYLLEGGLDVLSGRPGARAGLNLQPSRALNVYLQAAAGAGASLSAGVTRHGRLEDAMLGAFTVRLGLATSLSGSGLGGRANLLLDGLSRDAFGYADSGWSFSAGVSVSQAAAPAGALAASTVFPAFGLPWRVAAGVSGAGVSADIGPRLSLPVNWRLLDGVFSLDRVSLQPSVGASWNGDLDWRLALTATLDATLSYYVAASVGLNLTYRSREGFGVAFVGGLPLSANLRALP